MRICAMIGNHAALFLFFFAKRFAMASPASIVIAELIAVSTTMAQTLNPLS